MNYNIKNKFIEYHEKIVSIQDRWKKIQQTKQFRIETLHKIWEIELGIMVTYCIKHKNKNKKIKALLKKLQALEPAIRDKLILFYMQKRVHEHAVDVFEWIKHHKENQDVNF